jgi:hypothetical protein
VEVAAAKLPHGVVVFNPHPLGTARRLKRVATEYRSHVWRAPRRLGFRVARRKRANGAAQESNLPSVGLPRLTGFEGLPMEARWVQERGLRPAPTPSDALRCAQVSTKFGTKTRRACCVSTCTDKEPRRSPVPDGERPRRVAPDTSGP